MYVPKTLKSKTGKTLIKTYICRMYALMDAVHNGFKCRICGKTSGIFVPYHIKPKHYGNAVALFSGNVVYACLECNNLENKFRDQYRKIHEKIFGVDFMEHLDELARKKVHHTTADLRELFYAIRNSCVEAGMLK